MTEALLAAESVVPTRIRRVAAVLLAREVALRRRSVGVPGARGGTTTAGGRVELGLHLVAHTPPLEGTTFATIAPGRHLVESTTRIRALLAAIGLRHLENGTLRLPEVVLLVRPLVRIDTMSLAPVHRGTSSNELDTRT